MTVKARIDTLEAAIEAIVERVDAATIQATESQLREAFIDAVLELLPGLSTDELADLLDSIEFWTEVDELWQALTESYRVQIDDTIAAALEAMVEQTREFYRIMGVDTAGTLQAVRTSRQTLKLVADLDDAMNLINEDLQQRTLDVVRLMLAEGTIDRATWAEAIKAVTGASTQHAATQSATAISAYNQIYRNTVADRAELSHFLYSGSLKKGSRLFCIYSAGRVFTLAQLRFMDNGMLNPVTTFKGGWRCRHSLLPVDPEWDDQLTDQLVTTELIVLSISDTRTISVYDLP